MAPDMEGSCEYNESRSGQSTRGAFLTRGIDGEDIVKSACYEMLTQDFGLRRIFVEWPNI
jgi:hypothetical protein